MARIALDIDSTLHHYWDQFAAVVRRRHGVELPYDEQYLWSISQLEPGQLAAAVAETHSEELVLGAEPYPDAVETVAAWHAAGHWVHVTSHRAEASAANTASWLERIGLPYDDLYCSDDKVPRCVELEVDLLIDDSPINIRRAREAGIACATLAHPWNREICVELDVVCAVDWRELALGVAPLLAAPPA